MNKLFFYLALFMSSLTCFTSCSDSFRGLKINVISPESSEFRAGDTVDFVVKLEDNEGITFSSFRSQKLNFVLEETLEIALKEIRAEFSITIPEDFTPQNLNIEVEIVDLDSNTFTDQIRLVIIE